MPFLPTSQKSHQATENEKPVLSTTISPSNKLKDFEGVFPKLVKDLEENAKQYNIPQDNLKWYSDVFPPAPSSLSSPIPNPACHTRKYTGSIALSEYIDI